jgi:tRNA(Ile)-lysidine synthase
MAQSAKAVSAAGTEQGNGRPLADAEFAAALDRLGPFEERPLLAVAVSGGADSLALALLADRWARSRGGAVCALSVDHRLRRESGTELARLHGWLAARAIRHEILVWEEDKPATGIQAAARAARYRLLAGWCRAAGALHLLVAHHLEDQAETYLIRRRAGSGAAGLAGMATIRELNGCRLLRPLLGVAKERLIALLAAERQPFIADPSNGNPAFERARLRAAPVDAAELAALVAETGRRGTVRRRQEDAVAALLARAVVLHPAGFAALDPTAIAASPAEIAGAALAALTVTLGGAPYAPRSASLARLRAALGAVPRRGVTLGGCRFVPWRGRVLVLRELAPAAPPARLAPGASLVWDQRFVVSLPAAAPRPVVIGHLDRAGAAQLKECLPLPKRGGLPALVLPHLAAAWDEFGLLCVPHLGYRRASAASLPRLCFRPARAVSSAGFTVA